MGSEKNRQYKFKDTFEKRLNDFSSEVLKMVELAILHVKSHGILLAKAQAQGSYWGLPSRIGAAHQPPCSSSDFPLKCPHQ